MLKNCRLWLCLFLSLLSTGLAAQPKPMNGQTSTEKPAAQKSLALTEIQDLLKGGVSPKRVATLVEQYGVSFALTDDMEKELRKLGADSDLLLVIAKKRVQPVPNVTPTPQPALIWTDRATGLMWAKESNRSDITWNEATDYCENLTLAGYSNWRLPTIDELTGIYDPTQEVNGRHVKGGIELSGWIWSSSTDTSSGKAWHFNFREGKRYSTLPVKSQYGRALCVRRP